MAVAFDDGTVYAAFRCYNPTGSSARSAVNRRDGNLGMDNSLTVFLDTFHSRRDCYYFGTNSLGTQVDGRIGEDGRSNDVTWDCTWSAAAVEDSLGWKTEMAIPLNEIQFPEGENVTWGINFNRNYPEYDEKLFTNLKTCPVRGAPQCALARSVFRIIEVDEVASRAFVHVHRTNIVPNNNFIGDRGIGTK